MSVRGVVYNIEYKLCVKTSLHGAAIEPPPLS